MKSKNLFWIGLGLAICLSVFWQVYPLPDAKSALDALPLAGPGFIGQDVPLTEFELAFFRGVNVLKRVYKVDNHLYFVTVLDGTRNRHVVVHDPYYCSRERFMAKSWENMSFPYAMAKANR